MVALKIRYCFRRKLADGPLAEVQIPLDAQAEPAFELLELIEAERAPFVVPVAENAHVPEETPCLRIVLGRIPGTRAGRIEELGNDDGIFGVLLPAYCGEAPGERLGQ